MPKVTIVIPTYNRAKYLKEAINSVLSQKFDDFELFILDNASKDNTTEVVKKFTDKRIKYIRNDVNIGGINNINKGLTLGSGKYIIIFHDDDIMLSDMLRSEVAILDNNVDVVLVATNINYINDKNEIIKRNIIKIKKDTIYKQKEYIEKFLKMESQIPCPSVMLRRSFIRDNNFHFKSDVGPAADNYLWFEMNLLNKKFYLISEPLLNYRIHEGQDSNTSSLNMCLLFLKNTASFLKENKMEHLLPFLISNYTHAIIAILCRKLSNGDITKETFFNTLEILKNDQLWPKIVSRKDKLKIKMSLQYPKILKILYKIKGMF